MFSKNSTRFAFVSRFRLADTLFFRSVPQKPQRKRRPMLETLEGRQMLSTFTATNLADSGAGSLRSKIVLADFAAAITGEPQIVTFATNLQGTIQLDSPLSLAEGVFLQGLTGTNGLATDKVVLDGSHLSGGGPIFTTTTPTATVNVQDLPLQNLAEVVVVQTGQAAQFLGDDISSTTGAFVVQPGGSLTLNGGTDTKNSGVFINATSPQLVSVNGITYVNNTAEIDVTLTATNQAENVTQSTFAKETGTGVVLFSQLSNGAQVNLSGNSLTGNASAYEVAVLGTGTLASQGNTFAGNGAGNVLYANGVTVNSTSDVFSGNTGPVVIQAIAANANLSKDSFTSNKSIAIEAQGSGTVTAVNTQFTSNTAVELSDAVNASFTTDNFASSPVSINGSGSYTFNGVTFSGGVSAFVDASLFGSTAALSFTGSTFQNLNWNPTTKTVISPTGGAPAIVFNSIGSTALVMSSSTVVNCYNDSTANPAWTGWTIVATGGVNFTGLTINTNGGVDVILGANQSASVNTTNITDTASPLALKMIGTVTPDTSFVRMIGCTVVGSTSFVGDIADVHLTDCTFGPLTFGTNGTHEQD